MRDKIPDQPEAARKRLPKVLHWAFGIGLLAWILTSVSWDELASQFADVIWIFAFLNLILKFALRGVAALKWHSIVRISDPGARFGRSLTAYYIGTTVSSMLPSFGADAAVMYAYYRQSGKSSAAVSSVLLDRLIGLYLSILLANIVLVFNLDRYSAMPTVIQICVAALAGLVLLSLSIWFLAAGSRRVPGHWIPVRLKRFVSPIRSDFDVYRKHGRSLLWKNCLLLLVTHALRIASVYTLALAVGVEASLVDFAVVAPLLFMLQMLPIPGSTIGWEQGVFIVMLGTIGVSVEAAFAISILNRALLMVSYIPGGIALLLSRSRAKRTAKEQTIKEARA